MAGSDNTTGAQLLRIIDAQSGGHLQTLVTNMDVTALVLADVYGDSALEIVLGTAGGFLHTFKLNGGGTGYEYGYGFNVGSAVTDIAAIPG